MIYMFMGEYHHNIDEKGRVVLPGKFRDIARDKIIVSKGIEKCLYLYTTEEWENMVTHLNKLPYTKRDTRAYMRNTFAGATASEFDRMGRINITSPLISYAGLTKNVVIIGVNDHIEIWDKETFENYMNENASKIEDIAENLFEGFNETL